MSDDVQAPRATPTPAPKAPAGASPASPAGPARPESATAAAVRATLSLWAAIGYAALLFLASIAVAFSIRPLADSLDLSRLFR